MTTTTRWWCTWTATDDPDLILADDFATEADAEAHAAELMRRGVDAVRVFEMETLW